MKTRSIVICLSLLFIALVYTSCNKTSQKDTTPVESNVVKNEKPEVVVSLKDYGAEPTILDIEEYTSANTNFRTALWTGKNLQVTLMAIPVGGEIGLELHPDIDQFLRIEEGNGKVMMGNSKDSLNIVETAYEDYAVFVPAGKWHNIVNTGDKPLKLYSIYSPVEHPHGTVHKTAQEAMEADHH